MRTGTAVTAAARFSDGTLVIVSGVVNLSTSWHWFASPVVDGCQIGLVDGTGDGIPYVRIGNENGKTLVWVALYEGAYDADTLPPYVSKGKHVEMLNCGVPLQPRNLLDNSDFRNPVNQRGATSWASSGYTIDRWRTNSAISVSLSSTGITLDATSTSGELQQNVRGLPNGTYTFAAYVNGVIRTRVFTNNNGTITSVDTSNASFGGSGYLTAGKGSGDYYFQIKTTVGYTNTVAWAALYEGAYDASSLPAYQPKGYAAELVECQRYYENSWFGVGKNETQEYIANVWSSGQADARIEFKQQKRISPTITFYPIGTESNWKIFNGSYQIVNSVENRGRGGLSGFIARVSKGSSDGTTWTVGDTIQAQGHWEASADL